MHNKSKFWLALLLSFGAVSCGNSSSDADRLARFDEALMSGAPCKEILLLGNDITTGSPELEEANRRLPQSGCLNDGVSFFVNQSVTLIDAETSTTQMIATSVPGDEILTTKTEQPLQTTTSQATSLTVQATTSKIVAPIITTTTLVTDGNDPGYEVSVEAVLDANHIRITGGWPVSLIGLARPNACSEPAAISMLSELLPVGTKIGIIYGQVEYDDNGNALLYVTRLSDGVEVNATILANGILAHDADPLNPLFIEKFASLATNAKQEKLGNWDSCGLE